MILETFFNYFEWLADAPNGVQKLRELILQLAVMGKLVPQDKNDEPASVLLEKIKAEKAKLVKEKKIKKSDPLPPITDDEIPYSLPDGWVWVRLDDICLIIMGQSPPSVNYNTEQIGLPFYQGKADFGDLYPTPRVWCDFPKKVAEKDDILISVRAPVGATNICYEKSCIGRGLASLRSLAKSNHFYLLYFLQAFEKLIASMGVGSTFTAISKTNLETFLIALPPLNEQQRIVEKVDQLMKLCDELETRKTQQKQQLILLGETATNKLINAPTQAEFNENWQQIHQHFDLIYNTPENIKQLRQTILQLAVMGKLVPQDKNDEPASVLLEKIKAEKAKLAKEKKIKKSDALPPITDDEIPYSLPDGWVWVRFVDITSVITCGIASTPNYTESGKIFLSAKNVKPYRFMPEKHKFVSEEDYLKIIQGGKPEFNDILLTRVGAGIGEAAIIDQVLDFAYYVSLTLIKPFHKYLDSKYLLHWLNSPEGITKALVNTYGKGVSQGNLNVNQVRQFVIPLPPLNEQHRIVEKVDQLMRYCDQLESQLTQATEDSQKLIETAVNQLLAS